MSEQRTADEIKSDLEAIGIDWSAPDRSSVPEERQDRLEELAQELYQLAMNGNREATRLMMALVEEPE
jgi:glutamyl/glutaminyl-tRNA synthetase